MVQTNARQEMTEAEYEDMENERKLDEHLEQQCEQCGKSDPSTEYYKNLDQSLCDDCLGEGHTRCESCGEFYADEFIRDRGIYICEYCIDG